jgi:hypothetical protein
MIYRITACDRKRYTAPAGGAIYPMEKTDIDADSIEEAMHRFAMAYPTKRWIAIERRSAADA